MRVERHPRARHEVPKLVIVVVVVANEPMPSVSKKPSIVSPCQHRKRSANCLPASWVQLVMPACTTDNGAVPIMVRFRGTAESDMKLVGAVYDLATGQVRFLD
jgi:hypothetical protein